MLNKVKLILFYLISISSFSYAQIDEVNISLNLSYGNKSIFLADFPFSSNDSSNLQISTLKFYISEVKLLKKNEVVFEESNSFHLVDAAKSNSLLIALKSKRSIDFDELVFSLGIDSITNVSGAMGGDLDPTSGMYWTWQSGYINFKLEGKSNLCNAPKNEFQFHLGGYSQPYCALQKLVFKVKNTKSINLSLDVKKMVDHIDLGNTNHIMSPSTEAVLLSRNVANSFSVIEN